MKDERIKEILREAEDLKASKNYDPNDSDYLTAIIDTLGHLLALNESPLSNVERLR